MKYVSSRHKSAVLLLLAVAAMALMLALPAGALAATTPQVTGISPASGIPGANVTISGSGFGATQGTSGVTFWMLSGFYAAPAPAVSWSDTRIICHVPNTGGNFEPASVYVTVPGVAVSNQVLFTVENPVLWITALTPSHAAPGAMVTISGRGFGAIQGTSSVVLLGAPGSNTAPPSTWSDTQITFAVPAGMATGAHTLLVIHAGFTNFLVFNVDPAITSLSSTKAKVGKTVTITGTGFGAVRGASRGYFGKKAATKYVSWSDTSVKVKVPTVAKGSRPVKVVTPFGTTATKSFKVIL